MNELQIFKNDMFGEIRTIETDGKILFCGKDVAKALGYKNPQKAIRDHCKGVNEMETPTKGGMQNIKFIPESDLYRLIVNSKLESAQKFEKWVFEDVLPTIRNHGMYATDELLNNPDFAIAAFQKLKEEKEKRQALELENATLQNTLKEAEPKITLAENFALAKNTISLGDMAKVLHKNGLEVGRNKLIKLLKELSILDVDNRPYQKYIDSGYFQVIEKPVNIGDGCYKIAVVPRITFKGQKYLFKKLLVQQYIG